MIFGLAIYFLGVATVFVGGLLADLYEGLIAEREMRRELERLPRARLVSLIRAQKGGRL